MQKLKTFMKPLLLLSLVFSMLSCGGGGDDGPDNPPDPPDRPRSAQDPTPPTQDGPHQDGPVP